AAFDGSGNVSSTVNATATTIPGIAGCMNADTSFTAAGRFRQLPTLTGLFTVETDITPFVSSANNGVFGLSPSSPTGYTSFGVIVRFFTSGNIDVRNGGAYTADATVAYSLGTAYHFRIPVNVSAHTYSVYVTPSGGVETLLAANYAFRTEQSLSTAIG